jgi:hypothetical protein
MTILAVLPSRSQNWLKTARKRTSTQAVSSRTFQSYKLPPAITKEMPWELKRFPNIHIPVSSGVAVVVVKLGIHACSDTDLNAMQSTTHISLCGNNFGPNYSSIATQTTLSPLSQCRISNRYRCSTCLAQHTAAPPLKLDSLTFSGPTLHIDDMSLLLLDTLHCHGSHQGRAQVSNASASANVTIPVARASPKLSAPSASAPVLVKKLRHSRHSCPWAYLH